MVEIFTTKTCIHCVMAKNFMKEKGIEFVEYNISTNEEKRNEAIGKYHAQGVPLIVVNETPIYGFKPEEILSLVNKPAVA